MLFRSLRLAASEPRHYSFLWLKTTFASVLFNEEIRIYGLDEIRLHGRHSDLMIDHQFGQLLAINQNDASLNLLNEVQRTF